MTTIMLPAPIETIHDLEADAAAAAVTTALRASATTMSDVSEQMKADGAPDDWTGDAAEAADHAMTNVGNDTDAASTALTQVATACDTYVDKIVALTATRADLVRRSGALNTDIDNLTLKIGQSTADDIATLKAQADTLQVRADGINDEIVTLWNDVTAAEDVLIAAFQTVDSTSEGQDAADRDTTDIASLRNALTRLGGDPEAINQWWQGLSDTEREALKTSDPDLVGNTNGIPTGDRDDANRSSVDRDIDRLTAKQDAGEDLDKDEQKVLDRAKEAQKSLDLPLLANPPDTTTDVNLIVYQPGAFGGDGAVAVSYGDPDTADNTAVIVPGILNDGTSIAGQGNDAYTLQQKAMQNGESAATIAWMGYDAPNWNPENALDWPGDGLDMGSVLKEGKAAEGGENLANFVDGLRSTDQGDKSNLTVIGHSYGSTTASHAAHDFGLNADSLALVGSPGAGGDDVNSVDDLGMDKGKVYVGAADNDFVTWLGRDGDVGMGKDPAQADFGAKVFPVAPGSEFHADELSGKGVDNHTSYFDPKTNPESLSALTKIVQGDEPTLTEGRTQDANDMATDWAKDEIKYQVKQEIDTTVQEAKDAYNGSKDWLGNRVDDVKGWWP